MNLIGYITVDDLLIVYGNIVARVIVRVQLYDRTCWNIMKQSFCTRYLTFFSFLCNET